MSSIPYAGADSVKDIILAEVDPGGTNGTVVSYHDELTPEQEAQFASNKEAGLGYFISPVATVTRTSGGVRYAETTKIFIVPLDGGAVVVPLSVKCTHSGCTQASSPAGCGPTKIDGQPACSGASCSGDGCGAQDPSCSKVESTDRRSFLMFGSV